MPFIFHRNVGVPPPFTGVAVNIILSPSQTGPAGLAVIVTTGKVGAVTEMAIVLDVAVAAVTHVSLK